MKYQILLKDKECEHNKVYWKLDEYIGVGSAANSYIDGYRLENKKYRRIYRKNK